MVDSWIRIFSNPLKIQRSVVINRIPHLLNNRNPCLDASFSCFSTAVDEKGVRKTILTPHCQQPSNNSPVVHRAPAIIRSNKSCFPSTPKYRPAKNRLFHRFAKLFITHCQLWFHVNCFTPERPDGRPVKTLNRSPFNTIFHNLFINNFPLFLPSVLSENTIIL
jgi:hypothetical protein